MKKSKVDRGTRVKDVRWKCAAGRERQAVHVDFHVSNEDVLLACFKVPKDRCRLGIDEVFRQVEEALPIR